MKRNLFDLKDKVIIITGGYGVLGSAIAKYPAQQQLQRYDAISADQLRSNLIT